MIAKDLLKKALADMGADGLYNGYLGCDEACGCGLDDFIPCDECNLDECEPAKLNKDGCFYPIEEDKS